MSKSNLKIIPFDSSDEHYEILYRLEKSLDYKVSDFGSIEMLKYYARLIPEKCKPQTDLIELNNEIIGYGYTGHDSWAFDKSLLDSNLSFPSQENYLECAQEYLEYQIANARTMREVKTFRAWLWQGNKFMTDFYTKNGFEKTQVEFISIISLEDFDKEKFSNYLRKFKKNSFQIKTLKELQKSNTEWEDKLYDLWHRLEIDVPTDVIEPQKDISDWKSHHLTPWFQPEDFYIVLDGEKWIALSTYNRGDVQTKTVSTELTGVLPEYRRNAICSAVKVHALDDLKKKGFKKVFTGNEENNPMFQINLKLGFQKIGTEIGCQLIL